MHIFLEQFVGRNLELAPAVVIAVLLFFYSGFCIFARGLRPQYCVTDLSSFLKFCLLYLKDLEVLQYLVAELTILCVLQIRSGEDISWKSCALLSDILS
jgi:hypothetical protein